VECNTKSTKRVKSRLRLFFSLLDVVLLAAPVVLAFVLVSAFESDQNLLLHV